MTDTATCLADIQDITAKVVAWVADPAQSDVTGFAVELMPSSYNVND